MTNQSTTEIVDTFISSYRKEYDFFDQAARLAAKLLEDRLSAAGIRSIVTSRAKSVRTLEPKIRERNLRKHYTCVKDIFDDIVDLAGVRVAMYFPGEQTQVDSIVQHLFVLHEEPKTFPDPSTTPRYKKRFSGYWATHYRAHLKEAILSDAQKRYSDARIEIQVASVLMHAWSEVEHDLVYKPQQGDLSEEEYAILDELNGMVLAGEVALELLQKAGKSRVAAGGRSFRNHYDLASHLLSAFEPTTECIHVEETALGGIDILYEMLKELKLGSPDQLKPYIQSLSSNLEKRPLADQIIDQLLSEDSEDKERYRLYKNLRASQLAPSNYTGKTREELDPATKNEINIFLQRWSAFENEINEIAERMSLPRIYISGTLLSRLGIKDKTLLNDFERTRRMRNELVHGLSLPSLDDIREATSKIQEIIEQIDVVIETLKKTSLRKIGTKSGLPQ